MHAHWGNLPYAISLGLSAAALTSLALARQLDQIIRIAAKCYRELRALLGSFDIREGAGLPSWDGITRIRRNSPQTQVGAEKCAYLCCTSGSFSRFVQRAARMAYLIALSIWGANIEEQPADKARKAVEDIFRRIHRDWLVKYKDLSEADRRATLVKMLFTDLLRGRRRRGCRHKVAVILASHLRSTRISRIPTGPPNRRSAHRVEGVMYDIISDVVRQLSDNECIVFLYRVFAEMSDEEIKRHTGLKLDAVKADRSKSIGILSGLVRKEAFKDRELLAVLREASRREGVSI